MNAFKPAFRPAIRPAITSVFGVQVPVVTPLSFVSQPQSKTVDEYSLATFSCEVTGGVAPYTYQWKKSGANVGTNSSALSFTAAATDKNASITVVVTDSVGTVITSSAAILGVYTAIEKRFIDALSSVTPYTYIVSGDSTRYNVSNDSLTYYTPQLAKINFTAINNSGSGQSASDWINNRGTSTLNQAIAATSGTGSTTILEMSLGINAEPGQGTTEIKADIISGITQYLAAKPDALIVFVSPVKMTTTRLFDQMYIEIAAQFPDSVYVSGKAATEAVYGDPDFYVDDTHPSDNGLARLINYIMEAILPAPSKLLMTLDDFGGDTGPDPFNIVIGTGYYRYSDGLRINDEDTTNWRSIDKIAVEPNFTVKFDTGGNQALCAFFDVNGVYIKSIYATLHSGSGEAYRSTVIPANVYYLGLSFTDDGTTWDALNYNVDISYILESSANLTQDEINAGNQITLGVG